MTVQSKKMRAMQAEGMPIPLPTARPNFGTAVPNQPASELHHVNVIPNLHQLYNSATAIIVTTCATLVNVV